MNAPGSDKKFTGYIPDVYDNYFVPLKFAPYATEMAKRIPAAARDVLEIAAGTGVVTRALDAALPENVAITATDLNQPMVDKAARATQARRAIHWRQADAMSLPFPDETFDVVVCQFGAMFFPDKAKAFAEARRVLRPGGKFLFNVWDRIEANPLSQAIVDAMAAHFPDNPADFFARTPHGYYDRDAIARDLRAGGFDHDPRIETVTLRARAASARDVAIGFCQGSPLRNEIEERAPHGIDAATDAATALIAKRFGNGAIDAPMQAHIITIRK